MSSHFPQFTYNGKTVILLPGSRFSQNDLNSRLHQMELDYDQSSLSKKYFIDLYEKALKDDKNKIKIFDRLLRDTMNNNFFLKKKTNINFMQTPPKNNQTKVATNGDINNLTNQQSFPLNSETFSFKNIQQKNNMSYNNVSNFQNFNDSNNIEKENNNWNKNYSENNIQYNFKDILINEIKRNPNSINNKIDARNNNGFVEQNTNYYGKGPNEINYMENKGNNNQFNNINNIQNNNFNQSNYDSFNNNENQSFISNQNEISYGQDQINFHINQSHPNLTFRHNQSILNNQNKNNIINKSDIIENNQIYNYNQNNSEIYGNNNNNFNQQYNNINNINSSNYLNLKNQYISESIQSNNNINNNKINNNGNQSINMTNSENDYSYQVNNNKDNKNNSISLQVKNPTNNNDMNSEISSNSNNNSKNKNIVYRAIEVLRKKSNLKEFNNKSNENSEENEQSNNTFISEINNYFKNKDKTDFCFDIFKFVIFAVLLLVIIKLGIQSNSEIREKISQSSENINDPKKIFIDIVWGTIKGILLGIFWKYLYIMIPLFIISYMTYILMKKNKFKRTCKNIIEDIKNELRKKPKDNYGRRYISENEIISKYSGKYKIDCETFIKKYLIKLKKLREKDHSLKIFPKSDELGVVINTWELIE